MQSPIEIKKTPSSSQERKQLHDPSLKNRQQLREQLATFKEHFPTIDLTSFLNYPPHDNNQMYPFLLFVYNNNLQIDKATRIKLKDDVFHSFIYRINGISIHNLRLLEANVYHFLNQQHSHKQILTETEIFNLVSRWLSPQKSFVSREPTMLLLLSAIGCSFEYFPSYRLIIPHLNPKALNFNLRDNNGRTVLHHAFLQLKQELIFVNRQKIASSDTSILASLEWILSHDVDITVCDNNEQTAFDLLFASETIDQNTQIPAESKRTNPSIKLTDNILFHEFIDLIEKYKGLSNIKVTKENQNYLDRILDQRIAAAKTSLLEDNLVLSEIFNNYIADYMLPPASQGKYHHVFLKSTSIAEPKTVKESKHSSSRFFQKISADIIVALQTNNLEKAEILVPKLTFDSNINEEETFIQDIYQLLNSTRTASKGTVDILLVKFICKYLVNHIDFIYQERNTKNAATFLFDLVSMNALSFWNENDPEVSLAIFRTLITTAIAKHGVQILNQQNADGNTLLHEAGYWMFRDAAEILIEFGADTTIKNKAGRDPSAEIHRNTDENETREFIKFYEDCIAKHQENYNKPETK
jgi:ankyrin repeat protein